MSRNENQLENKDVEAEAKFECQCCFDTNAPLAEVCMCDNGDHMFCRECVRRGTEVNIGENKTRVACFEQDCPREFDMRVLKVVLDAAVFARFEERRQAAEVAMAGLDNLATCPACTYAVILPDNDQLLHCRRPECGKVTCRKCGVDNHQPLSCDQVEKAGETAARTNVENKMAEAVIRRCPTCNNPFTKMEGCNLIKCTCGATVCYLCRKAVPDNYTHFYGQGTDPRPGLCPLFSDNKSLHEYEAFHAAKKAKETGQVETSQLKNDPSRDLPQPALDYNPNALAEPPHNDVDTDDEEDNNYNNFQREYDEADYDEFDPDYSDYEDEIPDLEDYHHLGMPELADPTDSDATDDEEPPPLVHYDDFGEEVVVEDDLDEDEWGQDGEEMEPQRNYETETDDDEERDSNADTDDELPADSDHDEQRNATDTDSDPDATDEENDGGSIAIDNDTDDEPGFPVDNDTDVEPGFPNVDPDGDYPHEVDEGDHDGIDFAYGGGVDDMEYQGIVDGEYYDHDDQYHDYDLLDEYDDYDDYDEGLVNDGGWW